LHHTFPEGCSCCPPRNTTIFAAKYLFVALEQHHDTLHSLGMQSYTSTPCCGERRDSEPALRDTPDTLMLPSSLTWNDAWASVGGFFVTGGNE
jgi:hypothetical protein